jgi:hypothetical protein
MPPATATPPSYIRRVRLLGQSEGEVRRLAGFRKGRHAVPDAITPTTQAFLARLCAEELAAEAEGTFQAARAALGYKRRELTLEVSSPHAVLAARDFTVEWEYAFAPTDPERWQMTRSLQEVRRDEVMRLPAFNELLSGWFSAIEFGLGRGVRVEAVIDAVEDGDGAGGLRVDYPSDCRHCLLRVDGVPATVRCDGMCLTLEFERPGAPAELIEAFGAVRAAFALTKHRVLAGLL